MSDNQNTMDAQSIYAAPKATLDNQAQETTETEAPGFMSFRGRVNRVRFTIAALISTNIVLLGILAGIALHGFNSYLGNTGLLGFSGQDDFIFLLLIPTLLIWFIVSLSYGIRRWHDMNASGWLMILCFIPYLNIFVTPALVFARGDRTSNPYGKRNPDNSTPHIVAIVILSLLMVVLTMIISGNVN